MAFALFREHPKGLMVCAATEMWERFSYYGMRALLVFYLVRHFRFSDDESFAIYGAYSALVYMAPILGGAIADRWLGGRKAVLLGGVLLILGHFGMAFEGILDILYLSLALIIVGVGFLKTSTNAIVGALYPADDPRRDAGFTYYYMLYNVGGFLSPLICGWVGERYGWRYGFGLAGIGMVLGLVGFMRGQRHLEGKAEPPDPERLRQRVAGVPKEWWIYASSVGFVLLMWVLLLRREVVGPLLAAFGAAVGGWVVYFALAKCDPTERRRLIACAVLTAFTIGFWAFYEQVGSSLALFSDRLVDRTVLGIEIPASTLQAIPSLFVMVLAPVFSALWLWLGRRGREPSTSVKFVWAIGQMAAAFLVLAVGIAASPPGGPVPMIWFGLNFLLMTTGELCLAPVGISMVSRLSPQRIVGVMMGAFLLAYSASSYLAGLIARLTSAPADSGGLDPVAMGAIYRGVFVQLGVASLVVAAVLLVGAPILTRMSRGSAAGLRPY
jgi:POT family proton-dependent oligopeptide transporter